MLKMRPVKILEFYDTLTLLDKCVLCGSNNSLTVVSIQSFLKRINFVLATIWESQGQKLNIIPPNSIYGKSSPFAAP